MKFLVDRSVGLRSPCLVAKALRNSSISRCLVVAVMLLSWLVVTNHCALAQLQGRNMRHVHCHASKDDAGRQAPADGMRECCKAIKANLAGKQEIKFELPLIEVQGYALLQTLLAPVTIPAADFLQDHGPPRVISFAESVLQSSLLSHAPPAFV